MAERPRRALRVGIWNLKVGRDHEIVRNEILDLLHDHDLDVLLVCEAANYARNLDWFFNGDRNPKGSLNPRKPRPDYRFVGFPDAVTERRDSAVIVRRGLKAVRPRSTRLSAGWIRDRKHRRLGFHEPRWVTSVSVAGVRFFAMHMPPGPFGDGEFRSRKLANMAAFNTLATIGRRRRRGRFVMGGDGNRVKSDGVVKEFARVADVVIKGGGIDWFAAHGVGLAEPHKLHHGTSDHWPKVTTIYI